MKKKALDAIARYHMPLAGRHVIAAVSGGSDSMAMLTVLQQLREALSFTLTAAHVNHGIRGEEAERDETFVRQYCEKEQIPLAVRRVSVPDIMKETGESAEECGRRLRYAFFREIDETAVIATAHNADDSAETFLLNLARGTGLKGLTGIPPVRGSIVRPLILCTKEEILQYCEEQRIPYITDSTNSCDDYSRNRIRRHVLPILRGINPAFSEGFTHTVCLLEADEEYLESQTALFLQKARQDNGFSVKQLTQVPPPLSGRVLFEALRELTGKTPEYRHVQAVSAFLTEGGCRTVNGGVTVQSDGQTLFRWQEFCEPEEESLILNFLPERVCFAKKEIFFALSSMKTDQKNPPTPFQYTINYDRIVFPVTVRHKRDGDRFRPAGRGMTKTLKKLFLEKHWTPEQKRNAVILEDSRGIVLAEGFGIDERFLPQEGSRTITITIRRDTNDR